MIAALRYARESGLAVRVRGGGHGPDRFAIDDDAVVIDLGMFESPEPYTARLRGEGGFLKELSPEVVAVLAEYQLSKPAPEGSMLVQPLGGAVARAGSRTTPLGGRNAPWAYQAGAAWPNFIPDHDPTRLRAAYGAEPWKGLQTVRAKWDPDDVLSAGHAITLP